MQQTPQSKELTSSISTPNTFQDTNQRDFPQMLKEAKQQEQILQWLKEQIQSWKQLLDDIMKINQIKDKMQEAVEKIDKSLKESQGSPPKKLQLEDKDKETSQFQSPEIRDDIALNFDFDGLNDIVSHIKQFVEAHAPQQKSQIDKEINILSQSLYQQRQIIECIQQKIYSADMSRDIKSQLDDSNQSIEPRYQSPYVERNGSNEPIKFQEMKNDYDKLVQKYQDSIKQKDDQIRQLNDKIKDQQQQYEQLQKQIGNKQALQSIQEYVEKPKSNPLANIIKLGNNEISHSNSFVSPSEASYQRQQQETDPASARDRSQFMDEQEQNTRIQGQKLNTLESRQSQNTDEYNDINNKKKRQAHLRSKRSSLKIETENLVDQYQKTESTSEKQEIQQFQTLIKIKDKIIEDQRLEIDHLKQLKSELEQDRGVDSRPSHKYSQANQAYSTNEDESNVRSLQLHLNQNDHSLQDPLSYRDYQDIDQKRKIQKQFNSLETQTDDAEVQQDPDYTRFMNQLFKDFQLEQVKSKDIRFSKLQAQIWKIQEQKQQFEEQKQKSNDYIQTLKELYNKKEESLNDQIQQLYRQLNHLNEKNQYTNEELSRIFKFVGVELNQLTYQNFVSQYNSNSEILKKHIQLFEQDKMDTQTIIMLSQLCQWSIIYVQQADNIEAIRVKQNNQELMQELLNSKVVAYKEVKEWANDNLFAIFSSILKLIQNVIVENEKLARLPIVLINQKSSKDSVEHFIQKLNEMILGLQDVPSQYKSLNSHYQNFNIVAIQTQQSINEEIQSFWDIIKLRRETQYKI
ncbi:hypothetical protein pb186bvf_010795 [Paramecium bursaria]